MSSVSPLSSQNSAVLAVASPPVLNISARLGGDPLAVSPEAHLSMGTRPWGPASDALGTMSPQYAGSMPILNNSGLIGPLTATISPSELVGGSIFMTRALTQLNEVSAIQQTYLASNYLMPEGRYLTPSAADGGYLTPPTLATGVTPGVLALNQAVLVSRGVSIVEPAFLVGSADALSPLTAGLNGVTSQGSLSSGMSPCVTVGYSEALGPIAPNCNPAIALSQPIVRINPPPLGAYGCTGL
jgi:hypothetical protein